MKNLVLFLVFILCSIALWAGNEAEPNDEIGDSGIQWAVSGDYFTGTVSENDSDIWRIVGILGDTVNIVMIPYGGAIQMTLYESDGTQISTSSNPQMQYSFQESKSIYLQCSTLGTYQVLYDLMVQGQSYHPQIPFTDGFTQDEFLFNSLTESCPWERSLLPGYWQNLALCEWSTGPDGIMQSAAGINLSGFPAPYLEFRHICFMDPSRDKGFVEYSVDGGVSWTAFPASALPYANNYTDQHPWFDASHSTAWADWLNSDDFDEEWIVSRFNLSQWSSCTDFRIRFRAEWGDYLPPAPEENAFWALDYVKFSQDLPSVPVISYPQMMATNVPTQLRISWTAQNATNYDVLLVSPQGGNQSLNVNTNYCDVILQPSRVYYLNLRANNQSGSSNWTSMNYSFITNAYSTYMPLSGLVYVTNLQLGDYQRSSGWDAYSYIQDGHIEVMQGEQMQIYLDSFMDESVSYQEVLFKLSIDYNGDYSFDYDEMWYLEPNAMQEFSGALTIPMDCPTGFTRLRLQSYRFGMQWPDETEDYNINILPSASAVPNASLVDFEPVLVGYPSLETSIQISNPGSAPLLVEAINFEGEDAQYFSAPGLSFPITVGQNPVTIGLVYHPQTVGEHYADLCIISNAINTPTPIALYGSSVAPNLSGAIRLNGYTKYVDFPTEIDPVSPPAVSIEAWINWENEYNSECIISKGEGVMEVYVTDMNAVRFVPTPGVELVSNYWTITMNEWSHIVCVYDPASMLGKIYIDGVDRTWQNIGSNPLSQPIIDNGGAWQIGRNSQGSNYFMGSLAELRVWDTARSLEDIRNNMHLMQTPGTPGLVANWRFDEPFGYNVYDSVNEQHGNMINCTAQDRYSAGVIIGEGVASTQYPEAGTSFLSFAECGLELSGLSLAAPAVVTVTRLDTEDGRNDLQPNLWILRHYHTLSGTASLSFHLEDDLGPEHLPVEDFLMLSGEINHPSWIPEKRANAVNLNLDTISFENASTYARKFQIIHEPMQAPTNVQIAKQGNVLRLSWTAAPYTRQYNIYSSESPYGPFDTLEAQNVFGTFWNTAVSEARKFYRVVSVMN